MYAVSASGAAMAAEGMTNEIGNEAPMMAKTFAILNF